MLDCVLRRGAGQGSPATGAIGQAGERRAEAHLREQGLRILTRNFRCKGGEIDLIAEHAGSIVFVEVRLRSHAEFGGAAASITPTKQRRIILAARQWLQGEGRAYQNRACRFDAVLLNELSGLRVEWLQAAFIAERL